MKTLCMSSICLPGFRSIVRFSPKNLIHEIPNLWTFVVRNCRYIISTTETKDKVTAYLSYCESNTEGNRRGPTPFYIYVDYNVRGCTKYQDKDKSKRDDKIPTRSKHYHENATPQRTV